MSYSNGEADILTTLRLHSNYNANNSNRGKYGVLNSGNNAYYVILSPGPASFVDHALGGGLGATTGYRRAIWTTRLQVYQRYVDDGTTLTNLEARVDEIIAHFDQYPRIGDTNSVIIAGRVMTVGDVEEVLMGSSSGPLWLRWTINVEWQEVRSVTLAE